MVSKTGHRPIVLVGGGTTKIGDPSGKDSTKSILTTKSINKNKINIKKILVILSQFGCDESDATMIDNEEWLDEINYIALREYGSLFSVNEDEYED